MNPIYPSSYGNLTAASPSPQPSILENQQVLDKLKKFRAEQSPEVTDEQMQGFVTRGENLFKEFSKGSSVEELSKNEVFKPSPENAVALMWFLTAKVAEQDKLFFSGSMRLAHGEMTRDYLKKCNSEEILLYARISTHFKENLGKRGENGLQADEYQSGLDLRGRGLPAGKNHVLFALQPDGTLFLKMEEYGCPPFWKATHRTFANFREFMGHAGTYVKSRFIRATKGLPARKEHVPKAAIKLFKQAMDELSPPQSWFQRLFIRNITSAERKEGIKFGLSRMVKILQKHLEENNFTDDKRDTVLGHIAAIENFNPKPADYTGEIKGGEVLIGAVHNTWQALTPPKPA